MSFGMVWIDDSHAEFESKLCVILNVSCKVLSISVTFAWHSPEQPLQISFHLLWNLVGHTSGKRINLIES